MAWHVARGMPGGAAARRVRLAAQGSNQFPLWTSQKRSEAQAAPSPTARKLKPVSPALLRRSKAADFM